MSTYSLTFRKDAVSGDTTLLTNITNNTLLTSIFGSGSSASTTKEFVFDRNIQRQTKVRVLTATFGDGYEQRVRNGINPKEELFSINFNNRTSDEITVLAAFLDNKSGGNFDIVINGDTIKVAAEEYSIDYGQESINSLSTQLRRVYEP